MYQLICFMTIALLIWFLFLTVRNHLHLKGIPMPPCNFFLGHTLDFLDSKDILNKFTKYGIEYGGIYKVYVPPILPTLIISDPNLIQIVTTSLLNKSKDYSFLRKWLGQGLITAADARFWRPNRRMLTPCFGRLSLMVKFVETFELSGDELVECLKDQMENTSIHLLPLMKIFTMNVMCESSMGISKLPNREYVHKYFKCIEELQQITVQRKTTFKRFDFWFRFTNSFKKQEEALKTVYEFFDIVMKERVSKVEDDEEENAQSFLDVLLQCKKKNGLTKEYVREEINTFLFGGHDTTATGISFTLYALARNPDIQEKVLAEQIDIFGRFDKDLKVTYVELKQMKYLELVIFESLRMFPPIPLIGRKVTSEFKLAEKYDLPKNHNIGIFIYGCHHNPNYFPEPEKFIPDRFLNPNTARSFMSFSNGPRNCIGNKFALLQMKSCVSKIVRNFKLTPPKPDYNIQLACEMTLIAKNGIRISLEKRYPL